ncbi:MAG: glycosyltransferase family 2 protein [Pseudomonadota bacterium]
MTMRWGLSATILAPTDAILRFAAYHLTLGAHRLYLYLDDDNRTAHDALKAHPKVRVTICDTDHWSRLTGKRPARHQVRQSLNATHAYNRRTEVDWLIHMDVDEFLVPDGAIADQLAALPADTTIARTRPMELLGGSTDAFKAFIPQGPDRHRIVASLYPEHGRHLRGGFVSHVAGKVFVRTGQPGLAIQIHDALQGDARLPSVELPQIALAHCHAPSWDAWRGALDYRLDKGAYRAAMKPPPNATPIHTLLNTLAHERGEAGLRAFYDEVIGDSPDMRARLQAHDLLRIHDLSLNNHIRIHFPDHVI